MNQIFTMLAQKIIEEGSRLEADRIVVFNNSSYFFATNNLDNFVSILKDNFTGKLKFQKKIDGRYADITQYSLITHIASGLLGEVIDLVEYNYFYNRRKYDAILRKELYAAIFSENKYNERGYRELLAKLAPYTDEKTRYSKQYLQLLIQNDCVATLNSISEPTEPEHIAEALISAAKISQSGNRLLAAEIFAKLKQSEYSDIIDFFGFDNGYKTFYSEVEKKYYDEAYDILASTKIDAICSSRVSLLASANLRFIKIYGPLLMFIAHHTSNVDINIVVVDECQMHVSEGLKKISSALEECTGFKSFGSIRFHPFVFPIESIDNRTLSACARYLVLENFAQLYERVYVIDLDLFPVKDFVSYIMNLPEGVGINRNRGFLSIYPWRRVMAGNLSYIKGADNDIKFWHDAAAYILKGLREPGNSWMLDQNALEYAAQKNSCYLLNNIPFAQLPVRSTWEKNIS